MRTFVNGKIAVVNGIAWYNSELIPPPKGESFIGIVCGDSEQEMEWAEQRKCLLAGIGGGNGYFGAGWQDCCNKLISDPPEFWRLYYPRKTRRYI